MFEFESVEQLNQKFRSGELKEIPTDVILNKIEFFEKDKLIPDRLSLLNQGRKIIVIYSPKAGSIDKRLALVWSLKNGLNISPLLAKLIGMYRASTEKTVMAEADKQEEPTIGTHIEVILRSFNDEQPIRGKVDTGATINSLHAENINIRKDPFDPETEVVDFEFNGKKYSMTLVDYQAVQSADGGVVYRPVVKFNVLYDGNLYEDVLFNLNDRSDMEDKLLIGMNLLKEIGYKIDPTKNESKTEEQQEQDIITEEEWQWIEQQINEDIITLEEETKTQQKQQIHNLYEFLLQQNVSIADLLKYVKTHTLEIVDKLES